MKYRVVHDRSEDCIEEMHEAVEKAMRDIGITAEGYAVIELTASDAVDTGRLRNSVTHASKLSHENHDFSWGDSTKGRGGVAGTGTTAPHSTPESNQVYIGTNVEYAQFIEFGARSSAPRPFLKPAIQNHTKEYAMLLKNRLKGG